jgi:hypothetical protein
MKIKGDNLDSQIFHGKALLVSGLILIFLGAISCFFTYSNDLLSWSWVGLGLGFIVENIGFHMIDNKLSITEKPKWSKLLLISGFILALIAFIFVIMAFTTK